MGNRRPWQHAHRLFPSSKPTCSKGDNQWSLSHASQSVDSSISKVTPTIDAANQLQFVLMHPTLNACSTCWSPHLVVEACAMMLPPIALTCGPANMFPPSTWATTWLDMTTAMPNCRVRTGRDVDLNMLKLEREDHEEQASNTPVGLERGGHDVGAERRTLLHQVCDGGRPQVRLMLQRSGKQPSSPRPQAFAMLVGSGPSASVGQITRPVQRTPFDIGPWHCRPPKQRTCTKN